MSQESADSTTGVSCGVCGHLGHSLYREYFEYYAVKMIGGDDETKKINFGGKRNKLKVQILKFNHDYFIGSK